MFHVVCTGHAWKVFFLFSAQTYRSMLLWLKSRDLVLLFFKPDCKNEIAKVAPNVYFGFPLCQLSAAANEELKFIIQIAFSSFCHFLKFLYR